MDNEVISILYILVGVLAIMTVSSRLYICADDYNRSDMWFNEYIRTSDDFLECAKILEYSMDENRKLEMEIERLKKIIGDKDAL